MSGGATHKLAAGAVGLTVCLADQDTQKSALYNPATAAIAAACLGSLPDLIEPAIHPHHRQFFHSVLVLGAVSYGFYRTYKWQPTTEWEKALRGLLLVAGAAYISHLVLDAFTAHSIPLVGKL